MKKIIPMFLIMICLFAFTGDISAATVSCGNITGIPAKIPQLTSEMVKTMQVAIPVILVILGSIDLAKGIMAGKEEEIKKGQSIFIKRLITAVIAFFVVVLVKFAFSVVADNVSSKNIVKCISCFIEEKCGK